MLPAERRGQSAIVNPRIFAVDLYSSEGVQIEAIDFSAIIEKAEKHFADMNCQDVEIRWIPAYIHNSDTSLFKGYSRISRKTSIIWTNNYRLNSNRKRNLRKAINYSFNPMETNLDRITIAWNEIHAFLRSRQLFAIDLQRVIFILSSFPQFYSLASVSDANDKIIAVALVNYVGSCMRIPNYFSNQNYPGAIDFLLDSLVKHAQQHDISVVDLGVSTDPSTGNEVPGILRFKSEFSAIREEMYVVKKNLAKLTYINE